MFESTYAVAPGHVLGVQHELEYALFPIPEDVYHSCSTEELLDKTNRYVKARFSSKTEAVTFISGLVIKIEESMQIGGCNDSSWEHNRKYTHEEIALFDFLRVRNHVTNSGIKDLYVTPIKRFLNLHTSDPV